MPVISTIRRSAGGRFADTQRSARLAGRFTGTYQCRQARRVDERQAAGFDGYLHRMCLERFADMCPERFGAGHVELAHHNDRRAAVGTTGLDMQGLGPGAFCVIRHRPSPARGTPQVRHQRVARHLHPLNALGL
jgi:hypothetical protein